MHAKIIAGILGALMLVPATARAQEMKEWTLLVFMNGFNNLDDFGAEDLNEMEAVGSTDDINVVVQWASLARRDVRRVFVTQDNKPQQVTSLELQNLGQVDMGDAKTLVDFIQWGVENFPAKRYFIDVWNHGSGWHRVQLSDISFDDLSGHHITTEQLGQAMSESARLIGHKVDLYGSDACLMGMVEVASELSDSVDIFVGAEEVEPLAGWPYDAFLREWAKNPKMETREVAKILTYEYMRSYVNGDEDAAEVTLSAFDLKRMPQLQDAFRAFSSQVLALGAEGIQDAAKRGRETLTFYDSDYADLGDFLLQLERSSNRELQLPEFRSAVAGLRRELTQFVVANDTTAEFARAQGAAFWLPYTGHQLDGHGTRYAELRFNRATDWLPALRKLNTPTPAPLAVK